MDKEKLERLQKIIDGSNRIVFFGGAGVSTESGIPDFRSVDGLYNQKYDYPPEEILSHTFFVRNTKEFYRFYFDKIVLAGSDVEPNKAHYKLAELEQKNKLIGVVTQNIDGLHQKAGSEKVFELHGTILKNRCTRCGKFFDLDYMIAHKDEGVPKCDEPGCEGIIKPEVVLYEEGLDQDTIEGAVQAIRSADTLIIGGTSLVVYPAAGLIDYFTGDNLVVINKSSTSRDSNADLVIEDSIGEVLGSINI